jgi:hypothetical protein
MKIVGGPEELATFVRLTSGAEKTEWLDAPQPVIYQPPTAPAEAKEKAPVDGFSSWVVMAVAFMIMWLITKS